MVSCLLQGNSFGGQEDILRVFDDMVVGHLIHHIVVVHIAEGQGQFKSSGEIR